MKRIISFFLAVLTVIGITSVSVFAKNKVIYLGFDTIQISTPTDQITVSKDDFKTITDLGKQAVTDIDKKKISTVSVPSDLTQKYDKTNLGETVEMCGLKAEQDKENGGFYLLCIGTIDPTWNGNQLTLTYKNVLTNQQIADMEQAAKALSDQLAPQGKTETEKIRVFYDYLIKHVAYDSALRDRHVNEITISHTPYTAFFPQSDGTYKTLCGGFAGALYLLCKYAGIHRVKTMVGDLGGYESYHAWNVYYAPDGTKYKIDASSGANHPDSYFMFTKNVESSYYIENVTGTTILCHH